MKKTLLAAILALFGFLPAEGSRQFSNSSTEVTLEMAVPNPVVTGPILANVPPGGPSHDYPFFTTSNYLDLAAEGYVEEEFFFSGTANRYHTPLGQTGSILSSGYPYKTRMIVRRPASADRFNGVVVVEWQNSSSGHDFDALWSAEAAKGESADDRSRVTVLLQGRNAWDGDVLTLRYFVTPDHPDVIRYTRDVLLAQRDSTHSGNARLRDIDNARTIINAFAGKLTYVGDPKQSADRVQYPDDTLRLRSGDCDDMTVCFASLLASMGISTAFVDVVPPSRPDSSHIFLLFDTGLDQARGASIAENPKRYTVRTGRSGRETLWLPIETTVIEQGFDEAWSPRRPSPIPMWPISRSAMCARHRGVC